METKMIPCLVRVGETHQKPRLISLDGTDKVTVGRSTDVTVCLMSNMISRCHAILNRLDNGNWSILDNKSLNGVAVNGEKIKAGESVSLHEGDLVQFGVAPKPTSPPEFVYKFFSAARVKRPLKRTSDSTPNSASSRKRLCSDGPSGGPLTEHCDYVTNPGKTTHGHNENRQNWSPFREYKAQLSKQDRLSTEKMKDFEKKLSEMQKLLQEKETAEAAIKQKLEEEKIKSEEQEKIVEELRQKEEEMKSEMKEKEKKFEVEKVEITKRVQEIQAELEEKLKSKEEALKNQLTAQREALILEKLKVEQKLQEEMNCALEEKDKHLETELLNQKENLDKVIANKELEQKVLESQLKDTQTENAKQKEATLRAREDVLANFTDLMETELQCSICSELFIKAASLNCSHSFCQLCISQWMKRKKECPICRAAFSSFTRSIVLDSYIERMVEELSVELKERRKQMTKFREEEQKKFDERNNQSGTSGRGRGGSNPRSGRGGRRRGGSANTAPGTAASNAVSGAQTRSQRPGAVPNPIILSSESEESDEDDVDAGFSDSESDMEGDADAYYGGYGRCFICGSRGHWANGCPLR